MPCRRWEEPLAAGNAARRSSLFCRSYSFRSACSWSPSAVVTAAAVASSSFPILPSTANAASGAAGRIRESYYYYGGDYGDCNSFFGNYDCLGSAAVRYPGSRSYYCSSGTAAAAAARYGGGCRRSRKDLHRQNRRKSSAAAAAAVGHRVPAAATTAASDEGYASEQEERGGEGGGEAFDYDSPRLKREVRRLRHTRNVGVFAHVDAGKTTVTERMLALAGVVRRAGCVDDGDTVTDFLPAERERGITIQSAAISFEWGWHSSSTGDDYDANDNVSVSLIDTPGHIDFSVEVSRSVAVLDGAVLVVDAAAGVQAQTETVWRAMTRPTLNNHRRALPDASSSSSEVAAPTSDHPDNYEHASLNAQEQQQQQSHEPLSCIAVVNKMDKDGSNFWGAVKSLRDKLPGANPVPIQIPLFSLSSPSSSSTGSSNEVGSAALFGADSRIIAVSEGDTVNGVAQFAGVVDLVHMRAVLWPDVSSTNGAVSNVEDCAPQIVPLLKAGTHEPVDGGCPVTRQALAARYELLEALAEVDEEIEGYYLNEQEPTNADLRVGLRRATISHRMLPVLISAALRGKGVEPVLDAIADLLPSPLDRMPPAVCRYSSDHGMQKQDGYNGVSRPRGQAEISIGHPLNQSLLALAFKVVHMKGRGGSGDGRVVFARVYSGELRDRDTVQVVTPPAPGEAPGEPRTERIGGMLELSGGRFGNIQDGVCKSGDVCAIVGLKSVATGDTLVINREGDKSSKKRKKKSTESVFLSGVSSPKPVLTVRVEAETSEQQARLSEALALLAVEDPSLVVEETDSTTLLSGLGELHIEVTLDRLNREYGLPVMVGAPSVAYRETIKDAIETDGLVTYDRLIGGNRMQGSVHLRLEPTWCGQSSPGEDGGGFNNNNNNGACMVLADPVVTLGDSAREFLGADPDEAVDDLVQRSEVFKALVQGCQGALKRGPLGPYAMANVACRVVDVDGEGGLAGFQAFPGALRAAAANAVARLLSDNKSACSVLEPTMSIELSAPNDMVGSVLSDLTNRRGTVDDVVTGDGGLSQRSALIRGDVPLAEILGYANSLRSLTGGEGAFTAEYKGHSPTNGGGAF